MIRLLRNDDIAAPLETDLRLRHRGSNWIDVRLQLSVSDQPDNKVLHNFCPGPSSARVQTAGYKGDRIRAKKIAGVCDNLLQAARKSLILNGEMSEWLKEHAWKAKLARDIEPFRTASTHTR